ncbi:MULTISPECIES: hypothetical protein [unclassified Paraburkholderia]|uniref:hypothetical protein n=1 Tax=unclassified Paraburkholderia TaxID=2615204 RepID=UPI0019806522|nr:MULTISPECIES: hypothetical protein [unclassified Paraburkholderia]MBN3856323.1 hypothetical protein [Paraburkholderia sp. Ac-20340]
MNRLHKAMGRLMNARSPDEQGLATRWVYAWSGAIGERRIEELIASRESDTLSAQ